MMIEIERVAALYAQELFIDATAIAIIGAYNFIATGAQRSLATIATMSANGTGVLHFPRASFITVGTAG